MPRRMWRVPLSVVSSVPTAGGRGRNDYPVRAVWNSILAGIVFGHSSTESLRRELRRNAQLRQICGFDIYRGIAAVPKAWVYTRFLRSLLAHEEELLGIFVKLSRRCYEQLPGFGRELDCDRKALASVARRGGRCERGDRRGDHEAKWGKHTHRSTGSDGTIRETVKQWFGYKLHLIADTTYELPVAFTVLPANTNEMPVMHRLLSGLQSRRADVLNKCEVFTGDRGYDRCGSWSPGCGMSMRSSR